MTTITKRFQRKPLACAVLAAGMSGMMSGAQAAPAELTLELLCPFPLIGEQPIIAKISADYPEEVAVGETLGPIAIDTITTVNETGRQGLAIVQAVTVTGTATSFNTFITENGADVPNNTALTVTPTPVPQTSGSFDVPASGVADAVVFEESQIGNAALTIEDLVLELTNLRADGSVAPLPVGQFTSDCNVVEGQNNVLANIAIVEGDPVVVDDPQEIDVTPTVIDYGRLQLGQTATRSVTVDNLGDLPLGISNVAIEGAGASSFTQSNNCTTVAGGSSCSVDVTYTASEAGLKSATLRISSDDADEPVTDVTLSGEGEIEQTPDIDVAVSSIDFGSIDLGTSRDETVTIRNIGTAALTINTIELQNNSEFQILGADCTTIAPNASCAVNLRFTANALESVSDVLSIRSEDPDEALVQVTLNGSGKDEVVQPGLEIVLEANGNTFIAANGGTLPLTGDIVSILDLATGLFTGDLLLEPTEGSFEVIRGWQKLKATAEVEFEPVQATEGSLVNGTLTATSRAFVKIPKVYTKFFGLKIPLGGGDNCRTVEPVSFTVQSPDGEVFQPLGGGRVAGSYELPALEKCGLLTSILSGKLAGPDNTIELNLTPAQD